MPKKISNKFTNREIQSMTTPGRYGDGNGLYFQITKTGARSWLYRFNFNGKSHEMGLGPFPTIPLKDAREKAAMCRAALDRGINPLYNNPFRTDETTAKTFGEFALECIDDWRDSWVNKDHLRQWYKSCTGIYDQNGNKYKTPKEYGYATALVSKDIAEIDTQDIIEAIKPIWKTLPETAKRTLGRWERIFDAAKVKKLRDGQNPAAWRGHLKLLLSAPKKLTRGHHKSVHYNDMPDFIENHLKRLNSLSASALYFTILTCVRTSEAIGATVDEFNLKEKIWTIPAARMKMKRPHIVPLPQKACELIENAVNLSSPGTFLFARPGKKHLSEGAMHQCLKGMKGFEEFTVHGFRASFRSWAHDKTNFPRDLVEACLAHETGSTTEVAYKRTDALERRRKIMQSWDQYINTPPRKDNVVNLRE